MPTSIVTLALYGCAFLSADGALNTVREVIRFGEVELPLRDLVVRHCLALVAFAVSLFLFKWRTIRAMRPVQFLIVALPAVALALIFIALALVEGLSSTGVFWVAAISCLAILLVGTQVLEPAERPLATLLVFAFLGPLPVGLG